MKRGHLQAQRQLARSAHRAPGERRAWSLLAQNAQRAAERAMGATYVLRAAGTPDVEVDELRSLRVDCKAGEFPAPGHSAGLMADAFLNILDAWTGRETLPERRQNWSPVLRAAAAAVINLLAEARDDEAAPRPYWVE